MTVAALSNMFESTVLCVLGNVIVTHIKINSCVITTTRMSLFGSYMYVYSRNSLFVNVWYM